MSTDSSTDDHPHPTSWTGWVAFGAAMIMLVGGLQILQGLITLFDGGFLLTTPEGLAVAVSFTTLGWIQIGLGVVSLAIGIGILLGATVALVAGVVVTALSAIAHMATIAAYPAWSVVVIVFDIFVIYAFVAHGREMKLLRQPLSSPDPDEEYWIRTARR